MATQTQTGYVLEKLAINKSQLAKLLNVHPTVIGRWVKFKEGKIPDNYKTRLTEILAMDHEMAIEELKQMGHKYAGVGKRAKNGGDRRSANYLASTGTVKKKTRRKSKKEPGAGGDKLIALIGSGADVIKALSKLHLDE